MSRATLAEVDSDFTLRIAYDFPAPPERVFQALTNPRDMEVWVWGGIGKDPEASVDLRAGGRYSVAVSVDDAAGWPRSRFAMMGMYFEVAPPKRLVYTVHWNAPVGYNENGKVAIDEVVTIDLLPSGSGTEVRYVHMGIPTHDGAEEHCKGILHTFKLLRSHLAG